jgi:hypothetical protein
VTNAREYFRVAVPARVALRVLRPGEEQSARLRVRLRHFPLPGGFSPPDEPRTSGETSLQLELLQRIAVTLARIEQKLEELARARIDGDPAPLCWTQPLEISVSACGFAGRFELAAAPGALVESYLDLGDAGLPPIPALARLVELDRGGSGVAALTFEELAPQDRERLVQLALRTQSEALRVGRGGDLR